MPYTVNGIGTWYWGKANRHTHRGTCPHCGRFVELNSYDTTLYLVFCYLPLIPLGKKRVIADCSNCRKHRVAGLRDWERGRDRDIAEVLTVYEKEPRDPKKAEAALGTALAYEDEPSFVGLATLMEQHLSDHAATQALLGHGFNFFGQSAEAEAAYRRSLALADDADLRRRLALHLLRDKRPDEAEPLLQDVLDRKATEDTGLIYLLVEGYQSVGRHDRVLALLNGLALAHPELEKDKEFKRYRKQSENNLKSGRAIASPNLPPVATSTRSDANWSTKFAKYLLPALLVLGAGIYLAVCAAQGFGRTVHLVNGLNRPYPVQVGGRTLTLPAAGRVTVALDEGRHQISVPDPDPRIPPTTVDITTSFFTRPFVDDAFIVNPDRTALIVSEQAWYSANPGGQSAPPPTLHVGQMLYRFRDVDYLFVDFPSSIQMSQSSGITKRTRIGLIPRSNAEGTIDFIMRLNGKEAAVDFLRHTLTYEPQAGFEYLALLGLMPPDAAVGFLRGRLADRPLWIEWHRVYQTLLERTQPEHDLEKEYGEYLAKEPASAQLIYLLGRVVADRARAVEFFERAASAQPPCAYAFYALAYDDLARAHFDSALTRARQARKLEPASVAFAAQEREVLLALRQYEALRQLLDSSPPGLGQGDSAVLKVRLLTLLSRPTAARALIDATVKSAEAEGPPQEAVDVRNYLEAEVLYHQGDAKGYAQRTRSLSGPVAEFRAALALEQVDQAAKALAEKPQTWHEHLLLAAEALRQNRSELAQAQIQQAADLLKTGDKDQRIAAQWLAGTLPLNVDAALETAMEPRQKCALLTLLGLRHPEHHDRLFALARSLNFDPAFPYLTLKRIHQ